MAQQPQYNVNTIANPDEITQLPAIGIIRVMGLEESYWLTSGGNRIGGGDHALLVALMIFVRAIDVKKFKSSPLRWLGNALGQHGGDAAVKEMLAAPIKIKWAQCRQSLLGDVIVKTQSTIAVRCRRGSIDKAHALARAPMPEVKAQAVIIVREQASIGFHGRGNSSHMKNRLHVTSMGLKKGKQHIGFDNRFKFALGNGLSIVARAGLVAHHQRSITALFQSRNQI